MVDVASFKAYRYINADGSKDISSAVCPPYDVISPAERAALVRRSAENVVQLELPEGDDKYAAAKAVFDRWVKAGRLKLEEQPSLYLIETTFEIKDPFAPQGPQKRYGVLTALKLETPGKGAVHPHERTLPKAKEDRLNLLNALRTNVSPIFGLFFDTEKKWASWVASATKAAPDVWGDEKPGLSHKMWILKDAAVIKGLRDLVGPKDLYIADGHHRYEVGWAFRESQVGAKPDLGPSAGVRYAMTYVCPMEEAGLVMLPTHRLVRSKKTQDEWKRHLETYFTITPAASLEALVKTLSTPHRERVIGWSTKAGHFMLALKPGVALESELPHRPAALRDLDVVVLHDLAMAEKPGASFLPEKELIYTRDMDEIRSHVAGGEWVAFLLASSGVESLAKVAKAGEVMPPKTTYFYPKVPTGFTMMPLDQSMS